MIFYLPPKLNHQAARILVETTICLASRTNIVLSDMLTVTRACRYSIWMAILTDDSYDIAVEHLAFALFTLMLTGSLIYLVNMTNGTLHAPPSIQTSARLGWNYRDGTDCPNHPHCCRKKCSSRYLHIFFFLRSDTVSMVHFKLWRPYRSL
jgi:hypothetical protein